MTIDPRYRGTTFGGFEESCRKFPDRTAIVYLGERFSYAELGRLVDRFAAGLLEIGVKPKGKVLLYLRNCPQWVIANYAINKIGAVVVPVSPIYTSHELEYIVNDAEVETVICLDTNFMYVREVIPRTDLKRVIVTGLADLLPPWKRAFGFLFDKIPVGKVEWSGEVISFKDVLGMSRGHLPELEINPAADLAYIMYTGGTTGFPKGVVGNHSGEVSYIRDMNDDVFREYLVEGQTTILMVNPLFHIMAKGFAIATAFNKGNTLVLLPIPEPDAILDAIRKYQVSWMLGVPSLYRILLENDRIDQYDLRSLRYCYCGGDVLPAGVLDCWERLCGVPIYQVYGSTEVGHVTYSPLDRRPSPKTVGKPLRSRKCVIIDPESTEPVPPGGIGELAVTSVYTLKRYWNKPEETARSYVPIGGEIYYRTGDFMRFDEEGEIEFVERSGDIIKYKGYRISASEVEAVLQDHLAVVGACVIGVPDEATGERLKAIVVLKQDARGVDSADLLRWCRERLVSYKVPKYIEFRDMLPKSKVGKLLRREIRDEEKRKLR
ncbi:class I adenylate-forming enzyme family protein [Candidatus Deferrimicrobium sp.]|jgi:long-chain acyl-CoA synthetase|uniref:class I adenylate-forming enzyme family protein n=1 Tax=Candidatus Deferrimicrobium sp. TaxID=3060586 RepID=UPI002ED7CC9A